MKWKGIGETGVREGGRGERVREGGRNHGVAFVKYGTYGNNVMGKQKVQLGARAKLLNYIRLLASILLYF